MDAGQQQGEVRPLAGSGLQSISHGSSSRRLRCPYRELHPHERMMQAAEMRQPVQHPMALHGSAQRGILVQDRCVRSRL